MLGYCEPKHVPTLSHNYVELFSEGLTIHPVSDILHPGDFNSGFFLRAEISVKVTPKFLNFHDDEINSFMDKSIQIKVYFILKLKALEVTYASLDISRTVDWQRMVRPAENTFSMSCGRLKVFAPRN